MPPSHHGSENGYAQALEALNRSGNLGFATLVTENREENRIGLLGDDQGIGHRENG